MKKLLRYWFCLYEPNYKTNVIINYVWARQISWNVYVQKKHEKVDGRFESVYTEAFSLANKFGTEDKGSRLCG